MSLPRCILVGSYKHLRWALDVEPTENGKICESTRTGDRRPCSNPRQGGGGGGPGAEAGVGEARTTRMAFAFRRPDGGGRHASLGVIRTSRVRVVRAMTIHLIGAAQGSKTRPL